MRNPLTYADSTYILRNPEVQAIIACWVIRNETNVPTNSTIQEHTDTKLCAYLGHSLAS